MTRSEISVGVSGRPGVQCALPSYFWAINFRCHANSVYGVTTVATCRQNFPAQLFRTICKHYGVFRSLSKKTAWIQLLRSGAAIWAAITNIENVSEMTMTTFDTLLTSLRS